MVSRSGSRKRSPIAMHEMDIIFKTRDLRIGRTRITGELTSDLHGKRSSVFYFELSMNFGRVCLSSTLVCKMAVGQVSARIVR